MLLLVAALAATACGSESATPEEKARDANSELTVLLEPLPPDERAATKDTICTGMEVGYSAGDWEVALDDPELRVAVVELQDRLAETEGANRECIGLACS